MEATYGFVYSGSVGIGVGIFHVAGSTLIGADLAGGRYRGHVEELASGELALTMEMSVPAGMLLVQGTSPQDVTYIKAFTAAVPPDFGDGKPFVATVPPGSVTLMVKRITDDWAPYAKGVTVDIRPVL